MPKASVIFTSEPVKFSSSHDLILQTLNRENNGYYQPVEAFEGTEPDWDKVPLFYGPQHPDLDYYDQEPEMCLLESGCRTIRGNLSGTHIEKVGHPYLKSKAEWKKEDTLEDLIQRGILSLSTAYRAEISWDDNNMFAPPKVVGPVKPHHVLFFVEHRQNQPGDKGSGIMNLKDGFQAVKTKISHLLDQDLNQKVADLEKEFQSTLALKDKEISDAEAAMQSKVDRIAALEAELSTSKDTISTANTAIQTLTDAKGIHLTQIETLTAAYNVMEKVRNDEIKMQGETEPQLKILQDKIKEFEQKEEDRKWNDLKADIPPGMIHGEKEAEIRKLWKEDPVALAARITKHKDELQAQVPSGDLYGQIPPKKRGAVGVQTYHWDAEKKAVVPDEPVKDS